MELGLLTAMLAAVWHGGAVPLFWVIGIVLIVVGAVAAVRGAFLLAVLMIVLGIVLGGLNLL